MLGVVMKYKNEFTDVVKPAAKAPGYSVVSPNLAAIAATGLPELVRGWCVWFLTCKVSR